MITRRAWKLAGAPAAQDTISAKFGSSIGGDAFTVEWTVDFLT